MTWSFLKGRFFIILFSPPLIGYSSYPVYMYDQSVSFYFLFYYFHIDLTQLLLISWSLFSSTWKLLILSNWFFFFYPGTYISSEMHLVYLTSISLTHFPNNFLISFVIFSIFLTLRFYPSLSPSTLSCSNSPLFLSYLFLFKSYSSVSSLGTSPLLMKVKCPTECLTIFISITIQKCLLKTLHPLLSLVSLHFFVLHVYL